MNQKAFARLLTQARRARGVTVEALAETCGVSASYLQKILSGKRGLGLDLFLGLCKALAVSPQYLLQSDLPPPPAGADLPALVDRLTPRERRLLEILLHSLVSTRE